MFTGIVECESEIRESKKRDDGLSLLIGRPDSWELTIGQSIAVNGVCLTVEECAGDTFAVTLVPETLKKTIFGIQVPAMVNLERAMQQNGRFDGHIMQGHVDTVGHVRSFVSRGLSVELVIEHDPSFENLTVTKGSIALDGVSLTVAEQGPDFFSVALIPYTLETTTLSGLSKGDAVNIEFDIIGKYVNQKNR